MINKLVVGAALLFTASMYARAGTFQFSFAGSGVGGTVVVTYGTTTDSKTPQGFEVTGISGTFSDSNNGLSIVNAPITGLEAIKHDTPEPTNMLAPHDFSRFAVTAGLPPDNNGFLTYDNLYYPGGSPPTASDYMVHGGFLDIYGLLFDIGGGRVVDFWSNGDFTGTGTGPITYGAAVATRGQSLDYAGGGVLITPEPSAFWLLASGVAGIFGYGRRRSVQKQS